MSEPEQRACRRIDLEIAVDLESDHNFFAGVASNVSVGGLFIATHEPSEVKKVGDLITVRLTLPGDERPLTIDAVVRWIRAGAGSEGAAGMGVQFLGLSPDAQAAISKFVQNRQPLHRGR